MMNVLIHAFWDSDAKVWVASSEGELGLVTEAESLDILMDKIRVLVPELVELNGLAPVSDTVPYDLLVHDSQRSPVRA